MRPPNNATEITPQEWRIKMAARKAVADNLAKAAKYLKLARQEAEAGGLSPLNTVLIEKGIKDMATRIGGDTDFLQRNQKHLIGQPPVWQSSPSTNQ